MIAEILAVGTELLLGDIANTNAQFLSKELAKLGINIYHHAVVGDNPGRLMEAYELAFSRADLVIATGGLGPTDDDITKEIAAAYFKLPLTLHEPSWEAIQRRFSRMGAPMSANNKKQALLPEGCQVLKNDNGTAPGVWLEKAKKILILLPGPPNELEPMFLTEALPLLQEKSDGVFLSKTLKVTGRGESQVAHQLRDLLDAQTNPTIAPYAKISEVWLRVTASAEDEEAARALIAPTVDAIAAQLGNDLFGADEDTLESVVIERLREKGWTLACAESCTGGLLTARLVDCPGVSDVLLEGAVTYANEAKIRRLHVDEAFLKEYGAVSPQVAAAMAEGIARTAHSTVGISTTGIAGPGGGTPDKPVGLVYVGLSLPNAETTVKELRLSGSRSNIRQRATIAALDFLRRALL